MIKSVVIHTFKFLCVLISALLLCLSLLFAWLAFKPINLNFALNWIQQHVEIPPELSYESFELAWSKSKWGPEIRLNDARWGKTDNAIYLGDIAIESNITKALRLDWVFDDISIRNLSITIVKEDGQVFLKAFSRRRGSDAQKQAITSTSLDLEQTYTYLRRIGGVSIKDIQIILQDNDSGQNYTFPYISIILEAKDDEFQLLSYLDDGQMILKKPAQIFAAVNKQTLGLHGRMLMEDFDVVGLREYGSMPKSLENYWPIKGSAAAYFVSDFEGSLKDIKNVEFKAQWKLRAKSVDITFPQWPNNPTKANEIRIDGDFNLQNMILGIQSVEIDADPQIPMYFPDVYGSYAIKEARGTGYFNVKNLYMSFPDIRIDTGKYKVQAAYKGLVGWPKTKNSFSVQLPAISKDDIMPMWPTDAGPAARKWVDQNIKQGAAEGILAMRVDHSLDHIWKTDFSSLLAFKDVDLNYLEKTPNIHVDSAKLKMQGETITIADIQAQTDGMDIQDAKVTFSNIQDGKAPKLNIYMGLDYSLQQLFKYLGYFNADLAKNSPVDINSIKGQVKGDLNFDMNLNDFEESEDGNAEVDIAHLGIGAKGIISQFNSGKVIGGKAITAQSLDYNINKGKLVISGMLGLGNKQTQLDKLEVDLTSKNFDRKIELNDVSIPFLQSVSPEIQQALASIEAKGSVKATLTSASSDKLNISLDLKNSSFRVGALGFDKSSGQAGKLDLEIIPKGNIVEIPKIKLSTNGLSATARTSINKGIMGVVYVDEITQNHTKLAAKYYGGSQQNTLDVSGSLDMRGDNISSELSHKGKKTSNNKSMRVNLDLTKMWTDNAEFTNVKGWAVQKGDDINQAEITAEAAGSSPIKVSIRPNGHMREVSVTSTDGGSVIRGFGLNNSIFGGKLDMSGRIDTSQENQPFTGTLTLSDFQVKDAPALTHLLGILSLSQLENTLSGNGIRFDKAVIPFRAENKMLYINNTKIEGGALGGTLKGSVGLEDDGLVDLSGMIVPFNSFSDIASKIPVVGTILTGVQGDGIFAADYKIRGSRKNMQITSNPLKTIAPGMLRDIFKAIEGN